VGIELVKSQHGFHIWRHTAGTLLSEKVGDLRQVQSFLRHADDSMTKRYVHSEESAILGAEAVAEAIFGEASV